jgi:hypothetical protein
MPKMNNLRTLLLCLPLILLTALTTCAATTSDHFSLDVYALRGPLETSAKAYISVLPVDTQITAPDGFKEVQVKVIEPNGEVKAADYTNVPAPGGRAVIDLGNVPLRDTLSVQVLAQTEQTVNTEVLNGTTAVTEFAVNPRQIVAPDFEGFGAQMNMHLYTALNDPSRGFVGNLPPEDVGNLEAKVKNMKPGLCRIFLSPANYDPANQNRMDSFYKTVALAQQAGAVVNVTWWFIERAPNDDPAVQQNLMQQDMREFADTLIDLVKNHGLTAVQQITIQNEVNTSWVKPDLYEQYYRLLDQYLRDAGIRDHIKFVGGDLVINNQLTWFTYLAEHMGDILDGWSVHIYWNYWDTAYMQQRLDGILSIYNNLSPAQRKPLSITEYGVRGIKTLNGSPILDVNPYRNGAQTATLAGYYQNSDGSITPVNETNIVGFEQAWFNMLSLNKGFIGLSKWDFYRAQYDFTYQDHSLIGYLFNPAAGEDRWPLRPAYYMEWLMANTTGQHWQVLGYTGASGAKLITPFRGPSGDLTLFALSTDQAAASFSVGDLPANTQFRVLIWNAAGNGKVTSAASVNSGPTGTVSVDAPAGSLIALTTVAPGPLP